jgi:hypothetical protein
MSFRWIACVGAVLLSSACGGSSSKSAPQQVATISLLPRVAMTLAPGKTLALVPVVAFADGSTQEPSGATWDTSNAATATVVDGLVTAVATGTVTITATYGGVSATRQVHVTSSPLVSFTTSEAGIWNLSAWPSAGGASGLAAADVICNTRAAAAGLRGAFVAWASDASDDAYCRVHGLPGKRAASCGRPALPGAAGPWVRPDGARFMDAFTPENVGSGVPTYSPPRYDETGAFVVAESDPMGRLILTNTVPPGVAAGQDCGGWTGGTSGSAHYGVSNGGRNAWFSGNVGACPGVTPGRLVCLQAGNGRAFSPPTATGKRVFVTSTAGSADLSTWDPVGALTGVAKGDAICRSRAAAASLPNDTAFKAWLSDGSTSVASHITSIGPWLRMDGTVLATDPTDLLDGALAAALDLDENGQFLTSVWVLTGSDAAGARTMSTCSEWTSASATQNGTVGRTDSAGSAWTNRSPVVACNGTSFRLFCFED